MMFDKDLDSSLSMVIGFTPDKSCWSGKVFNPERRDQHLDGFQPQPILLEMERRREPAC